MPFAARGWLPLLGRIASGLGLALRSGAAPLVLGLRLAGRREAGPEAGVPAPRWGFGLASKVALDEIFVARELMLSRFVSPLERGRLAQEAGQARHLFEAEGWLADPASYHRAPPRVERSQLRRGGRGLISYAHLSFESGYEPRASEPGRERWLAPVANRTAHAWLLEHAGRPRPWVLCVPGYRMGHPLVDFTGFRARWLHQRLGLNVAIAVLPLHGPRRVGRRSGDGFLSGDFIDTIHAQTQAVWDVRRLLGWLRSEREAPSVAAYGVSLGGYTGALLASVERRLDCVVVGMPPAGYLHLLRTNAPPILLRGLERLGLSLDEVERLLHVISPLAMAPRIPRKRLFLFHGVADRLASPGQAHALWQHWDEPSALWYQGSHVSFFWEREVMAFLQRSLAAAGIHAHRASPER